MGPRTDRRPELLRSASLRVTRQRTALLRVLERHPHRDVAFLAEAGIVRRIGRPGDAALYEIRDDGHRHSHRICRSCGALCDVESDTPVATETGPGLIPGFLVQEVEVTYRGLCGERSPASEHEPAARTDPRRTR